MNRALLRNALIVFGLALAIRWAADVVLQPHLGTYVMDSYDVMGQNILDGNGFSYQPGESVPTVTRAPFYPLWWAAELALFGRRFLLLRMGEGLVDAVTAALVVYMTAALCRLPLRRGPHPTADDDPAQAARRSMTIATLAGAVYAVQPFSVYYAAKMGTETWFTLWLVLFVWGFAAWSLAPSYRQGGLLGIVLGVLLLNKSTAIGLLVILGVFGVYWARDRRVRALLSLLLCVAVAGLVVTPWMIRNYRVSGDHLVPIQTLVWWNFWADFEFSSSGYIDVLSRHYDPGGGHPYALTAAADVEQEALFRTQALEWIASHPAAMAKKMGQNFLDFWYLVEGVRRSQVTAAAMTLELLLALAGGWLAWRRRRWRLAYLCAIVILYFAVVYTPIKSVFHYSLVIVPFLCVLQAFVLAWLLTRMPRRTRTSPPRPS